MKENIETIIEAIKKMKADVAKIHRDFIIMAIVIIVLTLELLIWIILLCKL
jgi:hypothetical protein